MPDSAQKILIDIASVSQRIVNTLVKYDGHKTVESFWLDKIVASSSAVLVTLNNALYRKERMVDDRLAGWLDSEEPQICLDTLNQMDVLLNANLNNDVRNFFQTSHAGFAPVKDKSSEAIRLFQKRKDYFHFLLMTDIWNCEGGARRQARAVSQANALRPEEAPDRRNLAQITQRVQQVETLRKQTVDPEKLNGILGWLNAWKCRDIHERTTLLRQPDTCTWLPDTKAYQTWRNAENSFLWLNGKAGSGKSVLASSVIEGLESTLQDGEALVFFYCDFRNEQSTSASEVMRSLLSQSLKQLDRNMVDPGDLVDELIKQRDESTSTISNVTRLARHISRAAKQFTQRPFVVIDALDECKDIEELLDALMELNKGGVRLFVTSRPLQVIKDGFSDLPSISMDTMKYAVSTDIKLHVTRELDSHRRLRIVDASLKKEISSALCEKADGMFRWVQCQLSVLKRCVTTIRIREALNNLPSDLNTTYERILLGINKAEEEEVVRRALEWLVAAFKPLQLSQVMESLSIDLGRRVLDFESRPVHGPALLDALGSLVTYDELTGVVILSHFSVKEYLVGESTRTKHPAYHINEQAAHTQLALLCMCYITAYIKCDQRSSGYGELPRDSDVVPFHATRRPRSSLPLSESHPLLDYVHIWGFFHLGHVNLGSRVILRAIKTLQSEVQQYPSDWERLCERSYSFYPPWPTLKHDLALYILIAFAPEPLLRSYIGRSKLKLKDGTNPLIYAARFCKVEHARTLLSSGVSLNRRGWSVGPDPHQVLPLEVAVDYKETPVVDLFLTEGSPVPCKLFVSALEKSFSRFPASIVARLLQTDQFVEWAADIRDEGYLLRALDLSRYSGHPPFHAAEQDIVVIQRRLVQIGCDTSGARFNETSLRHAASAGHISTVKDMLALNIPIPPDVILNASQSESSNPAMIRLFLSRGCDVDVVSPNGDTALHFVTESGLPEDDCLESVQVLIDAGCNPSTRNLVGETSLHHAASLGYVSVIKYLLSQHAPLPPDILLLQTRPLLNHHLPAASTILFLIREGADMHVISANGNTPLHLLLANPAIVSDECLECAKILINAGYNPCLPNALGETPVDVAAREGHFPVLEYLFSLNFLPLPNVLLSVSGREFLYETLMIKFLINNLGANIHVTCPNGNTVLHLSMKADSEEDCLQRIKILINAGCDTRACNVAGKTPFHIAAKQRYISVMEYLISVGTPVPSDIMLIVFEDTDQFNPRDCYPTIRFLLEKGGDIHIITENGGGLLHLAATLSSEHDALEVIRLLVRAGCSPRVLNSVHETPLHIAARCGHISVIDYLLSLDIPLPPDILLAAPMGFFEKANMIHFLIDKGADPSAVTGDGDTPLYLLLSTDISDEDDGLASAKILINAGCDPRAQNLAGKTAMHAAATYGFITVLEYLLSQDIPLPRDIFLASTRTIRFLLKRGVDVRSVATNYGDAARLMTRTISVHDEDCLECARFLISSGWDLSSRNSAGETVIHVVARQGDIRTLKYLLSQHVPLPADVLLAAVPSDERPRTVPMVHFLIREGASVDITASNGDTPLHLALRSTVTPPDGDFYYALNHHNDLCKLIEILLNYGSDPYARNTDGQTPFDLAEAKGHFFKENFLRLVRISRAQRSHS